MDALPHTTKEAVADIRMIKSATADKKKGRCLIGPQIRTFFLPCGRMGIRPFLAVSLKNKRQAFFARFQRMLASLERTTVRALSSLRAVCIEKLTKRSADWEKI